MYLYVKLNWDANHFLPAESNDCIHEFRFVRVIEFNPNILCCSEVPFYVLYNLSNTFSPMAVQRLSLRRLKLEDVVPKTL